MRKMRNGERTKTGMNIGRLYMNRNSINQRGTMTSRNPEVVPCWHRFQAGNPKVIQRRHEHQETSGDGTLQRNSGDDNPQRSSTDLSSISGTLEAWNHGANLEAWNHGRTLENGVEAYRALDGALESSMEAWSTLDGAL
ncbi:hypothetical protein ILYODFUR_029213 [Ilyodon furcidens]|uniref:Uncharacterized protein n=1 Tax=Ilyodon furcidens TaxID=33524 RepID=A0ABV0TDV4_9TELE